MAATETIRAQVTCDFSDNCTNTVLIQDGGIQRARRTALNSCDWLITPDEDICPDHKSIYLRRKAANAAK